MARIYVRRKEPGKGWRYKAVPAGAGRRPVFDSESKFHVRYPDASGKFVYSEAYDTLEEAQRAAAELPITAKAVAAGLTLDEYKDRQNAHRVPIKKAIDSFLSRVQDEEAEDSGWLQAQPPPVHRIVRLENPLHG